MKVYTLLFAVLLAVNGVYAQQPGDLDPTFGDGGKVITPFRQEQTWAHSVAIQADGKIVAAGFDAHGQYGEKGYGYDFALSRYNSNGSLDNSFGSGGKVITHLGTATFDEATSVAIQLDGKIVAGGYSGAYPDVHFTVVRYNADGSLDASFGSGGVVTSLVGFANSLAIQTDGKIVAAGFIGTYPNNNLALIRLNTDGSHDTSFGSGGIVITSGISSAKSVAIQSDGKIVAAGNSWQDPANSDFALARYNAGGSLDVSFGSGGIVITPVGTEDDFAFSIAIQSDGKIVAAGRRRSLHDEFALVRYDSNGSLDSSFGSGGKVSTQIGFSSEAQCVAIQSDGKIVAAGLSWFDSTFYDFTLARYNPNGSLDATFSGGDGISTIDFNNSSDEASAMAFDGQGRAVIVGRSNAAAFALARILLEPRRTHFDFDSDGRSDVSVFRPSDSVWYLNRSTQGFTAIQFGLSTDKIVPADYDGDGKTDIAVYRDGTWWRINSSDSTVAVNQFGIVTDLPVPADYTGDGRDEIAVYRSGQWWRLDLYNGQVSVISFGLASDKPVPADYDGDGRVDQAVYRNGEWHLNRSTHGYTVTQFGLASDIPLTGDFDGDGKNDLCVYRIGTWWILRSQDSSVFNLQWGLSTDTPAPADYDGDGKTDAAVFRDGTWFLLRSTSGVAIQQFGLAGDKPSPSAFLPQ